MKIRSITFFTNPGWPLNEEALRLAGDFIGPARAAFEAVGYEVETSRLATPPFPQLLPSLQPGELLALAQNLESRAASLGYDYVSLGPALPELLGSYALVPELLAGTRNVFFGGLMTSAGGGVSLTAVRACAAVIHRAAGITPDGFANLRFAALANTPPGSPFFPAAYAGKGIPAFALATEAADLAVEAFSGAPSLVEARRRLVDELESHGGRLASAAGALARQFGLTFAGIDFSLAPFPEATRSLGAALERLGLGAIGLHGSLAAASILADSLDEAAFPRAGFSGLMLPVLEDAVLAERAAQGSLAVKDLLLYSAVCGAGLDTLPLPGDTSPEALAALLLDVACLAQRLDKPLTARLMPIPGKAAGDPTGFDFSYFANSRVMALQSAPLQGHLAGEESFSLRPRARHRSL